jgi:hypothetical protein
MKTEEFKALTASVKELSKDNADLAYALKRTTRDIVAAKPLWKEQNKPFLIRAGIALIVLPEPVITGAVGTLLLAAGTVQEGIKRQAVYVDDLPKAFQSAMKDLKAAKDLI